MVSWILDYVVTYSDSNVQSVYLTASFRLAADSPLSCLPGDMPPFVAKGGERGEWGVEACVCFCVYMLGAILASEHASLLQLNFLLQAFPAGSSLPLRTSS